MKTDLLTKVIELKVDTQSVIAHFKERGNLEHARMWERHLRTVGEIERELIGRTLDPDQQYLSGKFRKD